MVSMTNNLITPIASSLSSINPNLTNPDRSLSTTDEIKDTFKQMMQMMMLNSSATSMSGLMGGDSSGSEDSLMGSSGSGGMPGMDMMIPMMMISLLEKLLSKDLTTTDTPTKTTQTPSMTTLEDARGLHINQFQADLQAGGDGKNANCGPTSLAMALHALGLKVAGESIGTIAGQAIDLARRSMVTDPARDGVDAAGNRVDSELSTFTNFDDLARGANAAGATSARIDANADSILAALQKGAKVIASGTFTGKYPLPWTGDRGRDNQTAPGGATAHIVSVTGYDSTSGQFIINDPARLAPLTVSSSTLDYFMQGNAGALSLSAA